MTYQDIIEYGKRIFDVTLEIGPPRIAMGFSELISNSLLRNEYAYPDVKFTNPEIEEMHTFFLADFASTIIARRLGIWAGASNSSRAQILSEENISNKIIPVD